MTRSDNCIQSVRLTDERLHILLDALDQQENHAAAELRKFKRSSFRTAQILLHVLDNGHSVESSFRVVARDLSADGLGFIHGQMLPPGKPVLVQIPRKNDEWLNILARVAHCRHVDGMIHQVGLKFVGFGTPRRGGGRNTDSVARVRRA